MSIDNFSNCDFLELDPNFVKKKGKANDIAKKYVTKSLNISQRRFFEIKFGRTNTKLTQKALLALNDGLGTRHYFTS